MKGAGGFKELQGPDESFHLLLPAVCGRLQHEDCMECMRPSENGEPVQRAWCKTLTCHVGVQLMGAGFSARFSDGFGPLHSKGLHN